MNAPCRKPLIAAEQVRGARVRVLERRITRDGKVPISADDPEKESGWRCIPNPPTADDGWFILDSSRDYKTEWGRWHSVEGRA